MHQPTPRCPQGCPSPHQKNNQERMYSPEELRMGKVWEETSFRAGEPRTGSPRLGRTPRLRCPPQPTPVPAEPARCRAPLHKAGGAPRREGRSVRTCELISFETGEGRENFFYRGCGKGPNTVLLARNVIQDA